MTTAQTTTLTVEQIITRYAEKVAVAADETPATDLDELINQLETASENLADAGIDSDDVDAAATLLAEARTSSGNEQQVLLNTAGQRLLNASGFLDDYELML
ncbi:hypothetical protein AB0M05_41080 [Streptomyces violaceusniger]|uniref:hypothetical protein n=1 Tax=Streptomyces violaceusniger TaxID=68280 RepID=UPI0034475BCC